MSADIAVSAIYEYQPVPEPMTVAVGMGLWWKSKASKRVEY